MDIGKLYGVGVGPGGADGLTLRAANCLRAADCLCLPQSPKETCRAWRIALEALPEIGQKECLCFDFRMTRDAQTLERIHDQAYRTLADLCRQGRTPAFLTLGDPTVYSTFGYMARRARQDGLPFEIVPGVTAFCACAAGLGIALCEGDEPLHIGTAGGEAEALLRQSGTVVLMKCGREIAALRPALLRAEREEGAEVWAVTECGTNGERRFYGAAAIPEDLGYMTTLIVKKP